MIGYNLYLKFSQDFDGHCEDPAYLYLAYATEKEALDAARILEQVYGQGRIEIDIGVPDVSLAE